MQRIQRLLRHVAAPPIGNTQQLSKALEYKTSLLKSNVTQNKTNGTSNHKSTSSDEKTTITLTVASAADQENFALLF